MSQNLPLSGLNVLEQCGWNGILTGRLLAEAGAKVIRAYTENQDPLEKEAPFFGNSTTSIPGTWFNSGKQLFPLSFYMIICILKITEDGIKNQLIATFLRNFQI